MSASRNNPVVAENGRPGTLSWLPQSLRFAPEAAFGETARRWNRLDSGRSARIEGWASHQSVKAGDSLELFVSMNPAGEFTLDLYRMGFYQGTGARQVLSAGPIAGETQPEPSPDSERLIECNWTATHQVSIPPDWLSGVYLGKLTRTDDGSENYVLFVLRDEREAELIAQTSDFTWQAYNGWPADFSLYSNGGESLYYGTEVAVSFERPYSLTSSPETILGTGRYFGYEFPFAYWLERRGYDVSYCSNLDTHRGTAAPARAAGFLSIGHDEYWTVEMYDNVRAAIDAGVSVGFFSGNICCSAIGLRPGASGRPDRVFSRVNYFGGELGVRLRELFGVQGEAAPDEGLLIGARNKMPTCGCGHWVCSVPDHWVFEGTGMAEGDAIPNLCGHEWQGEAADIDGLEIISRGPTYDPTDGPGEYVATVYSGPHGNIVFNASATWWATALAQPPGFQRPTFKGLPSARPDARAQRITENVLTKMIAARA
jgi:hypothetical protein